MTGIQKMPLVSVGSDERLCKIIQEEIKQKNEKLMISPPGQLKHTLEKMSIEDTDEDDDDDDDDLQASPTWSSSTSISTGSSSYLVVESYDDIVTPSEVKAEIMINKCVEKVVQINRQAIADVISGRDDRLVVIVGPCSIHNVDVALHYARELKSVTSQFPNLIIVMRTYFEKPRTTVGWKGLINDPDLDGSFRIERGIRIARNLLIQINQIGLPVATELLDTISPQYISDLISWGAIGARTTESQLHRELTSATPHPVGFKNGTDGGVKVAMDAMQSARSSHAFMGIGPNGRAGIVRSRGNPNVHVILRGGSKGTNFDAKSVAETRASLLKIQPTFHASIMIDCSHGNSSKDYRNQPKVIKAICEQLSSGSDEGAISGVMIESNIREGRQDIPKEGPIGLEYGVSITDGCVSFEDTVKMLTDLDLAVSHRRQISRSKQRAVRFS